jgi:hypothetical protein
VTNFAAQIGGDVTTNSLGLMMSRSGRDIRAIAV